MFTSTSNVTQKEKLEHLIAEKSQAERDANNTTYLSATRAIAKDYSIFVGRRINHILYKIG